MRAEFPDARSFGATKHFWSDAASAQKKQLKRAKREAETQNREDKTKLLFDTDSKRRLALRSQWDALADPEKQSIRDHVSKKASDTVRQFIAQGKYDDPLVMLSCLDEMSRNKTLST